MARLIDATELIREMNLISHVSGTENICIDCIVDTIDDAPTVDAVEVVRCNDCIHWLKDVPGCTDAIGRCRFGNYMVGAAGYCVYGERGEDEKTD